MARTWHRVGALVDLHVDEVEPADLAVERAVGQLHLDRHALGIVAARRAFLAHRQELALRHREGHVHRVLADDGGQRAALRPDEVADREVAAADPAGDRRLDVGVAEIELGRGQVRLLPAQVGLGLAGAAGGLVQPRLGRRLLLDQLRLAPPLDLGEVQRRLGAGDRGVDVLDLGLVGRLLDHEQQVARLDVLALGEQPLLEEALDPGAQVDLVHGLDPAGEAGRGRDVARLDLDHRDRRRRLLGERGAWQQRERQDESPARSSRAKLIDPRTVALPSPAGGPAAASSHERDTADTWPMQRRSLRPPAAAAPTGRTRRHPRPGPSTRFEP